MYVLTVTEKLILNNISISLNSGVNFTPLLFFLRNYVSPHKDRVTGHNPIQAIYMANGYFKKRFYGEK